MAKETFYFSHDYNARTDRKIKKLLVTHGYCGYGIFWAIIEDLYNNANALRTDYDSIAHDLHSDKATVISIINDFELFAFSEDFFSSLSVQRRLDERNSKSIKAKESAQQRWGKCERNANALPTQYDRNAIKESKVKERKVKDTVPAAPQSEIFIAFQKWVKENAIEVSRMKNPITEIQLNKMMEKFDAKKIKTVILEMHNWKPLNVKRTDAYLTFLKFAENSIEQKPKGAVLANGLTEKENEKIFGK